MKTILITGAGTGIGRDSAFTLAQRGHRVIAATLNALQAAALHEESTRRAVPLEIIQLDITNSKERDLILSYELDVLINNAAIGESGSLAEINMERVRHIFDINLFATLEVTQLALRGMIARERGTVIFISSIAGRVPVPFLMPYSMTKFALSAAGAGLRAEMDQLGKNIQISLIEPGAIHTGFNQVMTARQFQPMATPSYFSSQAQAMQSKAERQFSLLEAKNTDSIVRKIVCAAEAKRPRLRYTAPWLQGIGVRLMRIFGV